MPTESELREADEWLRKHEHELPKETDGSRVNHDPVIYFGHPDDYKLMALLRKRLEREAFEKTDSQILSSIMQAAIKASGFTPNQGWVFALRAVGCRQIVVANALKISRPRVAQLELEVKEILRCKQKSLANQ